MKILFLADFLPKSMYYQIFICIFLATELVCIPSELQASHFLYIDNESETNNNTRTPWMETILMHG